MSETIKFDTGAVRSADAGHLDFTSLPLVGLLGVARTAGEGATKYGRYNYMLGMPQHDLLNHVYRHLVMYTLGDRSEPHLEHAAWGCLAAIQSGVLTPELSKPHMLGPGATPTEEVKAHLDANKDDLARRRKAGEFASASEWSTRELPEVKQLLKAREFQALSDCTLLTEGFDAPATAAFGDPRLLINGWPRFGRINPSDVVFKIEESP